MGSATSNGCRSFRTGQLSSHRVPRRRRDLPLAASRAARTMIEGLELRKLLATVNGTVGNDTINVAISGANIVITVNGTPNNFTDAANSTIVINASDGNDTITVDSNGDNTTTINGGIGDDSVVVGNGDWDTNIASAVTFNGDAGTADLLRVNDLTDGVSSDNYTVTATTMAKLIGPTLTWTSAAERFILDGSPNPDTINLDGTSTATAMTINGSLGGDLIIVGNGDYDATILGSVQVNGGTGTDSLQIDDTTDTGADSYTLDTTFSKSSIASVLSMDVFETIAIAAPAAAIANTFNLLNYPTGSVIVDGGAGNDTFNVGGGDLDTHFATVSIQGQAGTDSLVVDDTTDGAGADTWDLNALQLSKGGGAGVINYDALLESVVINGSAQADLWNMNASTAAIPLTINAGAGNDTLDAAGPSGGHNNDVDNAILNAMVFNGGTDIDRVDLDDTGDSVDAESYTLSSLSFSKSSGTFGSLSFDGLVEVFELDANAGANSFLFGQFNAGSLVTVLGGAGNDVFNLGNVNAIVNDTASMVISGGVDTDTWLIDESGDVDAAAYTMTSSSFRVTGGNLSGPVTYSLFEQITFTGSSQPTTFNLNSYGTTPLTLDMGGGNDTVVAGGGDVDSNITSNLTITGGAGTDSLVVDDSLDGPTADTLTIASGVTTKSTRSLTYTLFETQQYLGNANATIITVDSLLIPTTITGGSGAETVNVTPTSQDIDNVAALLTVDGNGGNDTVTLNDTLDLGDDTYFLTATSLTKPAAGAFSGLAFGTIELLDIEANGLNNTFTIDGTATGTAVTISGGAGNDTFNVGGADSIASGFSEDVTVGGGGGIDVLNYNDQAFATNSSYTLSNIRVQRIGAAGALVFFNGTMESITCNAGTGNDNININQLAADNHTVNAGGGNDTVNIGDGSLAGTLAVLANLTVNGGAGGDSIVVGNGDLDEITGPLFVNPGGNAGDSVYVDDTADAGNLATNYSIGEDFLTRTGASTTFGGLIFTNEVAIRFGLNQSGTPITINDAAGGNAIENGIVEGNGGIDTFTVTNAPTSITVRGGAGLDSLSVNPDLLDVANVALDQNEDFQDISTGSGGLLTFVGNIAVRTQGSSIAAPATAGVVNFNAGTLIAPGANLGSYVDALERGFNGGAWNGASNGSFRSGTAAASAVGDALGYAVIGTGANQLNATTVAGGIAVAAGDLVVTYTLGGDADLDRDVDFNDLVSLAQNYSPTVANKNWRQGNFNYNTPETSIGAVSFGDLVLLAQNYNQSVLMTSRGLATKQGDSSNTSPGSRAGLMTADELLGWSKAVLKKELA